MRDISNRNLSIDSHCKGNPTKGDRDSGEASQGVNGNFDSGDKELGTRKMNKCVKKQSFFIKLVLGQDIKMHEVVGLTSQSIVN
jgi:hypothetical protein